LHRSFWWRCSEKRAAAEDLEEGKGTVSASSLEVLDIYKKNSNVRRAEPEPLAQIF
jgi:hypothetical protein